ncbi:MAG: peptidylprolyl isomerase [Ruminococcaceae bacterium]|nr:peptidylprolyl isomerase [Oscillospiraceae bacterium]
MKKILVLTLIFTFMLAGCSAKEEEVTTAVSAVISDAEAVDASTVEKMNATITIEGMGDIDLELYPSKAPQTVANFTTLAREGFYSGTIFHRVIEGFMIQGGDPDGTGTGGPGYAIKGEFAENGFENDIAHERGVISMARKNKPMDSAGSQFFIMHQDAQHLDGLYAAFGRVTSGMDIVDKIAMSETNASDKPLNDVVIEKITIDGPVLNPPEKIK